MHRNIFVLEFITAILFFIMLEPSFIWGIDTFFIKYLLLFIMMIKTDLRSSGYLGLFLFFFFIISIIPITHGHNIIGFLAYVMFAFIPFVRKTFALRTFSIFRSILASVTTISILVWIAVIVLRINLPYTVIEPLNELKDYKYLSYPFLVIPTMSMSQDIMSIIRFHGMFDEPGAIGTYCLIMLYIDNFNIKKLRNVVFLIAGVISMSLFFYISSILFIMLRVVMNKAFRRYWFFVVVGMALLFVAVQTIPVLQEKIGARLEYNEDQGTIEGDNRTTGQLSEYIKSIRGTNAYFWGDTPEVVEDYSRESSVYNAILNYGIVFVILYFVFMFFYTHSHLNKSRIEIFLFMILLFMTLYQRPGFVTPTYLFMFTSVVLLKETCLKDKQK